MLKKVFLSAAVAALVLTACDSDSSTSPKTDDQPAVNPAKTSDSVTVKDDVRQTPISQDAGAGSNGDVIASADVPCSVEKTSANSFVMTMSEDGVLTTITTTIAGGKAEIDYVSIYNESVSLAMVQSMCESNKQEALAEENATVTCDGRTMKVHQVDDAEIGFDGALESAKNVCKEMNAYFEENNSDPNEPVEQPNQNVDPDPTTVSNPATSGKATCQITEKTTNTLKMVMVQPDSGTIYVSYEYANATLVTEARFDFLTTMPMDRINQYCNEAKADALEMAEEDGVVADVNCDGYSISETVTEPASMNVLPFIAPEMTEYCEEIQKTGVIPDDDDDDF